MTTPPVRKNLFPIPKNIIPNVMEYGNDCDSGARNYIGFSLPHSSVKDRRVVKGQSKSLCGDPSDSQEFSSNTNQIYNSNTNIELLHALRDHSIPRRADPRRPSSSHGPFGGMQSASSSSSSTPVKPNDSFFAMLQDYQPAVLGAKGTDQRSPGPAEFMQGRVMHATPFINKEPDCSAPPPEVANPNAKRARDPKVKNKLHRFLVQSKSKTDENVPGLLSSSLVAKNVPANDETSAAQSYSMATHRTFMSFADMEEQQRQRVFAHFDCQSLAANLSYRKMRALLSAKASNSSSGSSTPDVTASDTSCRSAGNERVHCSELVDHCPHYCNELGGEGDHLASLAGGSSQHTSLFHRPPIAYSISILESLPNETLWRVGACPFQCDTCPIEAIDHGAHYYRRHFHSQKHENWFGMDEQMGPIAVSIKREKLHDTSGADARHQQSRYQFRMIIRTSELLTLRGIVLEESILNARGSGKSVSSKELLEYVAPEIQSSCLRLGVSTPNCEQQLMKLDEQGLTSKYKVGILYCRSGQSTEEDMYNNEDAGPAFTEFLETIGKRVRLKGFQHYKAGLDNKTDSTGTHSMYTVYKDCEIMFHVCTMLPFTPNNRQQLLRKRHIGNDIVTIVFQEPGALPFSPKNIRSQFQHVFLIVRAINPCTDNTTYRVAISRSKEVPVFGPPLPAGALFSRNKMFAEFILAKIINAENAAHRSEKFATLATRTRREYLKDLSINYCTNMYLDPGNKFSIFPSKKKEKPKIRFCGDISQRGAICWQIMFQDHGSSIAIECLLGISVETLVIIEEYSKQIIFVTPTRSILGWSTSDNALRIFYHNGECITINMRFYGEVDEQLEVIERLRAVTLGNGVMELSIRRNMMGQLGFHVQPDGIVTQVDATGQAWAAGMRRGYRLVEVCKIVVATLSYREMIDLLKTSAQLTFIVIKSFSDSTPRRGCFNKHCKTNFLSVENDYDTYRFSSNGVQEAENMNVKSLLRNGAVQQPGPNYKRYYDQNLSPQKTRIRSSHQSGSTSVLTNGGMTEDYKQTLMASSSYASTNDKWYDILEDAEQKHNPQNVTLSLHRQYTLKGFERPKLEESTSLPLSLNSSPLFLSVPTSQQSDSTNFARQTQLSNMEFLGKQPTDTNKLLNKHRSASKYEITDLKSLSLAHNDSSTGDMSMRTHNHSLEAPNVFEEKAVYKSSQKFDLHGAVLPSTSTVKTAKLLPNITSFNPMNSVQRNMGSYSRTNTFRRDLLELIGPSSNSHYDSLKVKRNSAVDRVPNHQLTENGSAFTAGELKQACMRQMFEDCDEAARMSYTSSRPATIANVEDSSKSFRASPVKPKTPMDVNRRKDDLSATPPLLPDAKKLDWTTLVDTATKAIILQLRDDSSCKPLSLCNNADDVKHEAASNLQETSSTYPLQLNCAPELKTQLSDLITDF